MHTFGVGLSVTIYYYIILYNDDEYLYAGVCAGIIFN